MYLSPRRLDPSPVRIVFGDSSATDTDDEAIQEPTLISFDNSGDGPLRVPGFNGISLKCVLPPDARFAHGIEEWRQAPAVTARELAMTAVMNRLTDRPNWHVDVFDDVVVARWRQDNTASIAMNPLLSDRAWDWCVRELRDKATEYRQNGHIRVLDTGSCVCKSDHVPALRTGDLAGEFRQAVKPVVWSLMQSELFDQGSWCDSSIIDSNMFPLVYGRSLVLNDGGRIEVENILGAYQSATTLAPTHVDRRKDSAYVQRQIEEGQGLHMGVRADYRRAPHYRWSTNYQTLPSEVEFVGDTGSTQVRLTSYINNLHPEHRDLYRAIEVLVSRAIPLWNDCLVRGQRGWKDVMNHGQLGPVPLRIITYGIEWENELPEWLLAFRVPEEWRIEEYYEAREKLLKRAKRKRDQYPDWDRYVDEWLRRYSDIVADEDKELPPPESHLWQRAKEYLELPEDGSTTPVPVPDDWQQYPWVYIKSKAERLMRFSHPEPGTAFSYENWKKGRHNDRVVVDLNRKRDDWHRHIPYHRIPYKPVTPPHKRYTIRLQDTFRSQGLQVIVNTEEIELTPKSPDYEGTDWHMEGQLNEHIVAVAIFAYDTDNITEPQIAFRQNTKLDKRFYHYRVWAEKGQRWDYRWPPRHKYGKVGYSELGELAQILGYSEDDLIKESDRQWQDKGAISVTQGRLITFPNVLEHRAEPFSLADRSRRGHCRYIKLYLVDPHYRICSTRNVPPQQHHWWAQGVGEELGAAGIPQEIIDQIIENTGNWPMGVPEARQHRQDFLKEHNWNNLVWRERINYAYFNHH
ncbi:hypothetical protein BDQ94DRAFT_180730 [Aspergillus welwitschiae]|uniref:Uncharacterized protein n=1 Tax=Aspergillus welwitschiae TaxID=1341132 RepID=A0A3F3PW03_9EURO|nr:hypothetical protein BDQ94DRAFT_180730 [Aspergillus welwitschiae]RDH31018.1 hypothetical protein BDQ94DRAFT_180730 [Aspergillus welwitschiae]